MRRRLHFLPYTVTIPPDKIIKGFDKILETEAEGILAGLIEGATQWYEDGLRPPEVVLKATDEFFTAAVHGRLPRPIGQDGLRRDQGHPECPGTFGPKPIRNGN
jgi:hypothetical protein